MPLQTSGAISMSDIASELGGSQPHSISEYYRGAGLTQSGFSFKGGFVPLNTGVPTSGTISFSDFYGADNL